VGCEVFARAHIVEQGASVETTLGSDIIPEFPSLALLLASLTIVAIAGFLYKKKLKS
jgi:hypothetical protein